MRNNRVVGRLRTGPHGG